MTEIATIDWGLGGGGHLFPLKTLLYLNPFVPSFLLKGRRQTM